MSARGGGNDEEIPTNEMIQTLKNLSKVEIDVIPSSGVLLYGLDGAEIRAEPSKLIPNRNQIRRVYLRYGSYKIGWIIDKDVPKCLICNTPFGLLTRRHHCRNCGHVICGNCSTHRAVIRQLKDELTSFFSRPESRVCDLCAAQHRLNEIWDAKPPTPTPPSPISASVPSSPSPTDQQRPIQGTTVPNSEQSSVSILQTPTEQLTNPAQYQYSDPVPLNLFPIMNEEKTDEEDVPAVAAGALAVSVGLETSVNLVSSPGPAEEAMSPSLHAFSIDDNEPDDVVSEDEESPQNKKTEEGVKEEEEKSPPTQRPAGRRASWLEQKLGINLHSSGAADEVFGEGGAGQEEEGEGGIDSDSDGDDDNASGSSASGESVNSSRLSSNRKSRSSRSRSRQSRSIRLNDFTSDSYDDSFSYSDSMASPLHSPASSYHFSSQSALPFPSPSLSPMGNGNEAHEPITVSQLKLHSEQQRLIQLERERKAEKLRQQQEQERLAAAASVPAQSQEPQVTPIKSRTGAGGYELSDQGLSPPVSSASSSPAMGPADSSMSSTSPSPAKRRSSLMWFFGMRDSTASASASAVTAKPSPILRRGSDPGIIPTASPRSSEEKRNSLSPESIDSLPPLLTSASGPPLVSSKSLPLSSS
jgi:hypothetical protein